MKILVVSNNPFSLTFNNGKTLEALFSWVNKEDLAQLYFHYSSNPDLKYCQNYYKVTDIDVLKNVFFLREPGARLEILDTSLENTIIHKQSNAKGILHKLDLNKYQIFRDILWGLGYKKKNNLLKWVTDFNPDVIFFVAGNCGFTYSIVSWLKQRTSANLYTYITDDYVIYPHYNSILKNIQKKRIKTKLQNIISLSQKCFVIGTDMRDAYSNYFRRVFIPIMNLVDTASKAVEKKPNQRLIISYFGNIALNRWKSILRLGKIVQLYNKQSIMQCKVRVYTSEISKHLSCKFEDYGIEYMGYVIGDDYNEAVMESDLLLLVESDDADYRSLTRLSVSTKIPEYLIALRPILAFGPLEVASISLISSNKIGYVMNSEASLCYQLSVFKNVIAEFLQSGHVMTLFAYNYAKENFDVQKVQNLFKQNF